MAINAGLVVEGQLLRHAFGQLVGQAEKELGVPGINFIACRLQHDAPGAILANAFFDAGVIHVFTA